MSIPTNDIVWEALNTIPDPEYGITIVEMGLIYEVKTENGNIDVIMTLTTPNCPSGDWIYEGVKTALNSLEGAQEVKVDMVFDPPWNPEMITESGRKQLGI